MRLLAKPAEDRYPNAAEVIAALEPFTRKGADGSTLTSKPVFAPGKEPPTAHAVPSTSEGQPGRDGERSAQRSIKSLSASSTDDAFASGRPLIHGDSSASLAETIIQPRAAKRSHRRWPLIIGLSGIGLAVLFGIISPFTSNAPSKFASREASAPGRSADDETVRRLTPSDSPTNDTGWHGWPTDAPKPAIAPFDADQAKQHQDEWATYLKVPVEYENTIGMKFRLIPPGEFTMGSTPVEIEVALKVVGEEKSWVERVQSEAPKHKVILTQPIFLGVHEVTQGQYQEVMTTNPSYFTKSGDGKDAVIGIDTTRHPVERVSWNDAAEFVAKLSQLEHLKPFYFRSGQTVIPLDGAGYRLPTEAQWEFACRAGTTTTFWSGDQKEDLARAGWFWPNSGNRSHAVGELWANPFGLYDIHGNVWEWVQDVWQPTYYDQFQQKPSLDPTGPPFADSEHVLRGGSWIRGETYCHSSSRYALLPYDKNTLFGFRVSLSVDAVRQALKVTGLALPNSPKPSEKDSAISSPTDYALEFDGQNDYVELPSLKIPSGPMSVEAWITTPQDWIGTAAATRGDGQVMTLYVQENNVGSYFAIDKLDCYLLRPFQVPSHDRMIHVAGVWDGTSLFCFIDGSLFAIQRASRQLVGDYLTRRSSIGADVNVIQGVVKLSSFFRGRIKELRISSSAKYQVPFTPAVHFESGEDTVALYHFDDGTGDVLSDSSGHDHHGKIVGAKWVNVDGSPITSPVPLVRTKSAVLRDSALAPGEIPEPLSLAGHTDGIWCVCINKAGTRIASSSSDKTVRVWDTTTGETVRVFSEHDQVVWRLAFSPEDDRIASPSSDGTVKVWDANTGHVHCTFSRHGKPAICAAFSSDGKKVASGGDDGMARIWDATTGEEEFVLAGHSASLIHITFSPVGKLLASGSWDGTVKIWNTETGKEERTLPAHSGGVFGVCFSPDGKRIASCGRDGNVKIWDLDAKEPLLIFTKNSATVTCASYSPDGNWIASCGDDRAVRIWNTTTGKEAAVFQGLGCHRLCFSADGRKVVGGEGKFVKVWDVSALARLTRETTPSKAP